MMLSKSFTRTTVHGAAAAVMFAIGSATAAIAQNYEGPHQVRVGAFLQGGSTTLDSATGALSVQRSFGNNGGGMTAGLEFLRHGGWTFGVEGDFGLAKGSASIVGARHGTDYFASLRGRVGVYARPDWVIYGTGGIGFKGVDVTELSGADGGKTLSGAIYGGGTEFHRGNTIFFAEYLHSNYARTDVAVGGGLGFAPNTYSLGGHSDAVRLGVKFKVGFDGYYDEVRDGLRK